MRVMVTGAAGLIGSHLCEALVERGDEVIAVDNLLTGQRANVDLLAGSDRFHFIEADAAEVTGLDLPWSIDVVYHLASPASPTDFSTMPLEILRAGSLGVFAVVDLAHRHGARVLLASTSEVYGEPLVHPQPEEYWGNVNPVGPRSCYDEAKRFAEAVVSTHARSFGLDSAIVRIFNTYGPRMRIDDGRVVSNFVVQALRGEPLTIQGDGSQTRSFCYVTDLARGLMALMDSGQPGPVNIGNPNEFTVLELAKVILELTGSDSSIDYLPLPQDDPVKRRPDITRARTDLGWEPRVELREGIGNVIDFFRQALSA
jgi:dTDP-glucose 4,6-dehydratase